MSESQQSQSGSGIFDRGSNEQVKSPEKLNEYIRIATPGKWLFVAALALILIALLVWGSVGTLPEHLVVTGIGLRFDFDSQNKVENDVDEYRVESALCFVDSTLAMGRDLNNKFASVVFRDGRRVSGKAVLIDTAILQDDEIHKILDRYEVDTEWVFERLGPGSDRYLVYVYLDETLDYLYWGETADVSIVVNEVHPIDLLLNRGVK